MSKLLWKSEIKSLSSAVPVEQPSLLILKGARGERACICVFVHPNAGVCLGARVCTPSCMYVYAYTHASHMGTELPAHTHARRPGVRVWAPLNVECGCLSMHAHGQFAHACLFFTCLCKCDFIQEHSHGSGGSWTWDENRSGLSDSGCQGVWASGHGKCISEAATVAWLHPKLGFPDNTGQPYF